MKLIRQWHFPRSVSVLVTVCAVLALSYLAHDSILASSARQTTGFTFTAVGDYGGTTNTDAVLGGIANAGANFNLALGDLSYGSYAPEAAWCNYVQSKVGASFPFELGTGNHDMDAQTTGHINKFVACLPDRVGNLTGSYGKQYYFDYNKLARVIFISPNLTLDGELYAYKVGSARYNWLVNAIDGARVANLQWVIVGMHKDCISTGQKSCEIGADLFNLLVSKKVDLVLQGHDHNYQRSKQLAFNSACASILPGAYDANCVKDDGTDNTYAQGAGMVLAIVGTGGQSLYGSNPADMEAGYFAKFVLPGDTARYGFLKVSVASDQLSAQFVPVTTGTFSDAFVIRRAAPSPTPTPTRTPTPAHTVLVAKGAMWKYQDNGSNQGTAWRGAGFNDTAWASGKAQLGYGDGDEVTVIHYGSDPNNKYVTTYFRRKFTVANPAAFSTLTLKLLRDDGAVVYLNGTLVARSNMPTMVDYKTYATTVVGGTDETTFYTFSVGKSALVAGTNVLAVEVHQANASSSDVSFNLQLTAR